MASSDPKGAVSASTRNSPGPPAESPVARKTVQKTGRVSDRVHTRQTTAAHAAQDGSRRDPPGTTSSWGPGQVQRGGRPAPLPWQGPAAGTKSPVLGRPPRAPGSHSVRSEATAPGVGEGTTAMGKPTGASRATGPDEARRTNAGPEARQRGTPPATTTARGQVPMHNGHRVPRTREARTTHDEPRHGGRCQGQRGPHARTPHPRPVGSGPRPHARKDGWSGMGERPSPDARHPGKRRPPPGTLIPPPQHSRARCGVGDGSPGPHPLHPQPVGSGPRPHARTDERSGVGEHPSPDAPQPGKRRPPQAASCRPQSTQERALWGW